MGTHQRPLLVGLHSTHEDVRDPKSVEQITGSLLLGAGVLLQLEEVHNVGMPRFQVNGEGTWPLVPSLVNVPSHAIEDTQHGH